MIATRHLLIHGRVQGVGYRASLAREAGRRGLAGWVRNRRDGSVEAVVRGDEDALDALVEWARRGPPAAFVRRVDVGEAPVGEPPPGEGFEQRPTR